MKNLKFGDKVQHDFSKNKGVIIDFRNDPQGYKWKVCFQGKLGDTLGPYTDWFKEDVLLEGWDNV